MPAIETQIILVAFAMLIPLTGIMVAVTPYFQPKGEVFSVSVPTSAENDPAVRGLKRRFSVVVLAVAAVFTVAAVACGFAGSESKAMVFIISGSFVVPVFVGGGMIIASRSRMMKMKKERGWTAEPRQSVAAIGEDSALVPRGISLKWNWAYVPIMVITAIIAVVGYDAMPDMIPMHIDFAGNVTDVAQKTPMVVAFPVLFEAFMAVCFVFSLWSALRSKPGTTPEHPASSSWAYGLFLRAQTVTLLVCGLLLTAVIGILMELSFIGMASLQIVLIAVLALTVLVLVATVGVNLVFGQSGSKVFRMEESDNLLRNDDACWKLGMIYVNGNDASIFVPKRSGFGWTVNWGRPSAWALMAGFALFTVLFVWLCFAMTGQ